MTHNFDGTTLAERIQMVLGNPSATSQGAARVLDQLIDWELSHGELGQAAAVALDADGARRWLTLLHVAAVFVAGRDTQTALFFVDEWINRGYAQVLGELVADRSLSPEAIRIKIAGTWSLPEEEFRAFLEGCLLRDAIVNIEEHPELQPRSGMVAELLSAA